jgi:hypothetical protein
MDERMATSVAADKGLNPRRVARGERNLGHSALAVDEELVPGIVARDEGTRGQGPPCQSCSTSKRR